MLNSSNLIIYFLVALFLMGVGTFIAGVLVLILRGASGDVRDISQQASRLVQKGLAEEVAGLVGNATTLLQEMNQMARTARGIGLILMAAGLGLMALSSWFALKLHFGSIE